ncbi:hypothetical protein Y032_0002g781 [Ancylostoma ceylanicum]|uniref:Uncharacterized protein n=1 Tax=Ancylostoma ceylanicum TaxID=53326 RepID=A0A016W178_9BILA|nr:hypothetical protein Y032_0002g781 [Ancylostoma ceylanicum]
MVPTLSYQIDDDTILNLVRSMPHRIFEIIRNHANDASCWGPSDSAPWGDRRSGGSPNSRKEFGKISVVNFSLPLDWVVHVESGHGNSSAKFLKYLEIILNYAIHTQASSEGNHESLDGKYVDIVSKFDPIKCSAVLNESKSNQKPLKSKGGETCLAHRKKIVGVCQCPPVPMGECCHRDKRLYVRKVPAKYVKFPVDVTVRFPSISLWLQQRWPQVLRSAESRLKSGIHDDLFKDASIIAE